MEKFNVSYKVSLSDFRQATYFALFQRHRTALRIMFVALAVAVLYVAASMAGFGTVNPLVLFLAAAYLIWGILLFAGAEKGVRSYMRSKDSLIGCTYKAEIDADRIQLEVPERKIKVSTPVKKMACAFELSSIFLLYTTLQDVYILPTRCLTESQRAALRRNFRQKLGNNFGSRFK